MDIEILIIQMIICPYYRSLVNNDSNSDEVFECILVHLIANLSSYIHPGTLTWIPQKIAIFERRYMVFPRFCLLMNFIPLWPCINHFPAFKRPMPTDNRKKMTRKCWRSLKIPCPQRRRRSQSWIFIGANKGAVVTSALT